MMWFESAGIPIVNSETGQNRSLKEPCAVEHLTRAAPRCGHANRLVADFPDDVSMRISHEAIYQVLHVQGRGGLRRELTARLRTGRALRLPRARTKGRGKKFVALEAKTSERPAEISDRAEPGQ